ncbi:MULTISPECIES: hypothetical protein [Burkholderiaceae]|uniref:hypothetical protein n=2 Tax=Burkholderiales TaxID=80840 RepID=UPI00142260C4|nr:MULTISPECIES: hypothetical protein [Burkholderiaceae]MBN3845227.1 hypothetical protein [Paraburkholderia sp. Ac-20342]NIF50657.1 hypothetical protein [Burkholderia sp. Ax-1724]NIF76671.1 hypothetical protein [Paraburkholderia sp. Cy-641]
MKKSLKFAACVLLLVVVRASGQSAVALQSSIVDAVQQMHMPNEGRPSGVPPSYSWQTQPVVQAGNSPPAGFHAITGWGQIFLVAGAAPVSLNVSLRNFRTYLLSTSGKLQLIQSTNTLDGAQFNPDYQGNINIPADIRLDSGGYTSVMTNPKAAFHFWPTAGKVNFDSSNLAGILVAVEARINPATGQTAAEVDNRYVLSVGADYWAGVNSVWDNYRSSAGVAVGRFQFLTTEWQCFTMTTIFARNRTAQTTLFSC